MFLGIFGLCIISGLMMLIGVILFGLFTVIFGGIFQPFEQLSSRPYIVRRNQERFDLTKTTKEQRPAT